MPLIQVRVIGGVFTEAQKRQIVHKLTDAMVSVEGESIASVSSWTISRFCASVKTPSITRTSIKGMNASSVNLGSSRSWV